MPTLNVNVRHAHPLALDPETLGDDLLDRDEDFAAWCADRAREAFEHLDASLSGAAEEACAA